MLSYVSTMWKICPSFHLCIGGLVCTGQILCMKNVMQPCDEKLQNDNFFFSWIAWLYVDACLVFHLVGWNPLNSVIHITSNFQNTYQLLNNTMAYYTYTAHWQWCFRTDTLLMAQNFLLFLPVYSGGQRHV